MTTPANEATPAPYYRVRLQPGTIARAVEPLKSSELRQYAYEMAVGICDADQMRTDAERGFLLGLRTWLKLELEKAAAVQTSVLFRKPCPDLAAG